MSTQFEDLLELSGGFGRYQWLLYAFFMSVVMVEVSQNAFMIFGKIEPAEEELCHFRNRSWYNGSSVDNMTGCKENVRFYSVTMEFDLLGPRRWIQGLMISIQYAAMILSALVIGQVSDRFGRKRSFVCSFVLLVISSISCSFSPNWQTFVVFRFFIGGFMTAVKSPMEVLCVESVPQNWRLFMNIGGYATGYCFLAFLAYFIRNWRYLLIASNMTAPITLVLIFWIHESPKWLMDKGRFKDAIEVFRIIGQRNRVSNWDDDIFLRVEQKLKIMDLARKDLKAEQSFLSYWHLFYDWRATRVLLVIIFTRSVSTSVFVGLMFNTGKLAGDVSLNLFLTMLTRGCMDLIPFLLDQHFHKVGRRHLVLAGLSLAGLCMSYSSIAHMTSLWHVVPITLNIAAYVGLGFVQIVIKVVHKLCLTETTPTLLRNMGDSLIMCCSRFGAIMAPQILLLFDVWKPGPFLLFLVELAIAALLVFFILPETKGKPLPDLPPKLVQRMNHRNDELMLMKDY